MPAPARARRAGALMALPALALLGCEDLRQFAGTWDGEVSRDPALRFPFAEGARLRANVGGATRDGIDLTLELPPRPGAAPATPTPPGGECREPACVRFAPIRRAADDILGEARLPGEPLRTYFGYVPLATEAPYLTVVSLFSEERVEVRLIRGPGDTYAVFYLKRAR